MPAKSGNFIVIDGREKAIKCDEISKDRAWNYHHSLKNSYLAVDDHLIK